MYIYSSIICETKNAQHEGRVKQQGENTPQRKLQMVGMCPEFFKVRKKKGSKHESQHIE